MWNLQRNNKKKILTAVLLGAALSSAHAEILVILPESGPMARAGSSIKQGFSAAYEASGRKEAVKYVNADQAQMAALLKKHVSKKTKMVVGPLAAKDVDALINAKPKVKVLALNEGSRQQANVWQFSLAKRDDAAALAEVLQQDRIQELLVLRQPGTEAENELFLMALMSKAAQPVHLAEQLPKKLGRQQGLLLMGSNAWLNSQKHLPKKQIYTVANALEQHKPLPLGVKFCDSPAVHEANWQDMKNAYAQQPVGLPYQRLLAFGGDAWQIAEGFLRNPKQAQAVFEGRTGALQIDGKTVQRKPHCYAYHAKGLRRL